MTTVTNKNLTIDDIRKALAGDDENAPIDVFKTNAGNIRSIIGRGSMATIQKFLNVIRDEIKGDNSESDNETPALTIKPDNELLSGIWNTVVNGVNEAVLKKIVSLNDDRDSLRDNLSVATQDIETLTGEVERLESELDARIALESEITTLTARLNDAHDQNTVLAGLIKDSLDSEGDKQDKAATRKQRTVITPEITCEVLDMLSKGVVVGDIAKNIDISVGSVNKIKKEHDEKMQNHRDKLNIE